MMSFLSSMILRVSVLVGVALGWLEVGGKELCMELSSGWGSWEEGEGGLEFREERPDNLQMVRQKC